MSSDKTQYAILGSKKLYRGVVNGLFGERVTLQQLKPGDRFRSNSAPWNAFHAVFVGPIPQLASKRRKPIDGTIQDKAVVLTTEGFALLPLDILFSRFVNDHTGQRVRNGQPVFVRRVRSAGRSFSPTERVERAVEAVTDRSLTYEFIPMNNKSGNCQTGATYICTGRAYSTQARMIKGVFIGLAGATIGLVGGIVYGQVAPTAMAILRDIAQGF